MDSDTGAAKKRSDTRGTIKSLADFALAFPTCLVVISYLIVSIFFFSSFPLDELLLIYSSFPWITVSFRYDVACDETWKPSLKGSLSPNA